MTERDTKHYFTVEDSVQVVQDRAGPNANPRVKFVADALASQLDRDVG